MSKHTAVPYDWNREFFAKLVNQAGVADGELASKIGISLSSFRNYLSGKTAPALPALVKIADYFQVPIDILMSRCSEEDYDQILKGNAEYMLQCRKAAYEQYLLKRSRRTDCLLTNDRECTAVYPYNLIEIIFHKPCDSLLNEDRINGLNKALSSLSKREQLCVDLYFNNEMTYAEVGKVIGLTKERVRQIIACALRKLRHPSRAKLIMYGLQGAKELSERERIYTEKQNELKQKTENLERKIKEVDRQSKEIDEEYRYIPVVSSTFRTERLEDMDLSVRTFNCLARYFHWDRELDFREVTVDDVCDLVQNRIDEFRRIRNLGLKSEKELLTILRDKYEFDYFYLYPELLAV